VLGLEGRAEGNELSIEDDTIEKVHLYMDGEMERSRTDNFNAWRALLTTWR
jgi:hypothetical protein